MIQTKDSNLTFRPLTIDDAEQYNALLRYAFQVTEQELSESGWKDDEIKQSKFPVLVRADVLGCFCEEDLVSQFAVYPLDMNIYGVRYPVGFVTSVCTYPEYTATIWRGKNISAGMRMIPSLRSTIPLMMCRTATWSI